MKLIVQVPCYNEEETLPLVINSIPKGIPGIAEIETLIIDDGSKDKTIEVAQKLGVNHIIRHKQNRGLARAFETGIEACLQLGADIIVNTDGDNQYPQEQIDELVRPILDGEAEIVIADRQTDKIAHFSPLKKLLQNWGSLVVRFASDSNIPDAVSGFRAYSREAAMQMNIVTNFSYVIETIVQASKKRIPMTSVPVKTNPKTRESRLFKGIWQHVKKSSATLVRVYAVYEPFRTFLTIGTILMAGGIVLGGRYVYFVIQGSAGGHIQSLILAAILLIIGFQTATLGLLADLVGINRKLLEKVMFKLQKNEHD